MKKKMCVNLIEMCIARYTWMW